jgi:hypothetical protein
MRDRLAALSALVLVATLAGCASIPTSGGVQQGPARQDQQVDLDVLVDGPQTGATQAQILQGFIDAAASPRNNYQVAREFLTDALAAEWQADAGATVDVLADREMTALDETRMQVSAVPVANLAANGQYLLPESAASIPLEYAFEQVGGEWRISSAPTGILIDESTFELVWQEYTLYFFDPQYRYLVPDVRWFAGRESAQTSIVRALLVGPAEWLEPGVVSAFPDDLQLQSATVPVSGDVAEVSLTGPAFDSLITIQRMRYQLEQSLLGVRNILDVRLILNGGVEDVPALADPPERTPRVDQRALVSDGTAFGFLSATGEGVTPVEGISDQVIALGPSAAALGPDAAAAAVRSDAGVSIVRTGEEAVLLDPRDGLVAPSIDNYGVVWSVPADRPEELIWYGADGAGTPILVPWTGTRIAAIEVSRDSTRIVALLVDGSRSRLVAASIQRDGDGNPQALGPVPLALADVAGVPLDAAWLDSRTVGSISESPDGGSALVLQELGGRATVSDGPVGATEIVGANSLRDLRVLTDAGDLVTRAGVGWQVQGNGIRLLAPQQPD